MQKYIVGQGYVPYTEEELAKMASDLFDRNKREKLDAVNDLRDEKIFSDIVFNKVTYQADEKSQGRINKAMSNATVAVLSGAQEGDFRWHGHPVDFVWLSKNNNKNKMDAQTTIAFGSAVAAREGILILAASEIKKSIEKCTTQEELDAIDITQGWPS